VLLRLWRFARPYRLAAAGRLSADAGHRSTAATLVPPYLTMPLMDKVLIPFQNGQQIDPGWHRRAGGLMPLMDCLGRPAGSALLAWACWAGPHLHAGAGVRAHRRRPAHHHLRAPAASLSLDYFGSKRTGDLMARIGSETDRINVFLSLHALDFATDVLMIAMTAAILFSINPWLALVTLVPLPFIAWMIHTGARPPAHRLREDRPRLGRGHQRAGRHHSRHPRGQGLCPGRSARPTASATPTSTTWRSTTSSTRPGRCSRPPSRC
jgi:ATP-binding cassette subfamily B protein